MARLYNRVILLGALVDIGECGEVVQIRTALVKRKYGVVPSFLSGEEILVYVIDGSSSFFAAEVLPVEADKSLFLIGSVLNFFSGNLVFKTREYALIEQINLRLN